MKINITVDLQDIIEDGGDLTEEVKHSIIQGVKGAIAKDCLAEVQKKASTAIDSAIETSIKDATIGIQKTATEFASNWLENEVVVTNKWGEKSTPKSIKDIVKETFDRLLEKKVDASGKFSDGYSGSMSLVQYLSGKMVNNIVEENLKGYGRDIDKKIKEAVNSGIKEKVADKFAELVTKG